MVRLMSSQAKRPAPSGKIASAENSTISTAIFLAECKGKDLHAA